MRTKQNPWFDNKLFQLEGRKKWVWSNSFKPSKFYIRKNNNIVDSIETGRKVIAHLLPWSDLEKSMYTTPFLINDDKTLSSLLNL